MNASDAVLVTSTREAGPMVVKEAAACNVPVVATDVGFVRETLAGVEHAHVCESEAELVDGLEAVLDGRVRSDGRTAVDLLGTGEMSERLADVYRRAVRGEDVADV
jgi:glycosyltransferase involved in cell wall biosynthesis